MTPEQAHLIQVACTRVPLKGIAFAGAGKTSTLTGLARTLSNCSMLYMAFNKAIATDAKMKFPGNVECKTSHSVAFRTVAGMGHDPDTSMGAKIQSRQFLTLPEVNTLSRDKDAHGLSQTNFASTVYTTLRHYMQSSEDDIKGTHVPNLAGLTEKQQTSLDTMVVLAAMKIWEAMSDPSNPMPLGHDGYVKVWALTRPRLRHDVIMIDEAQDLNAVLIGALRDQTSQLISVGDSHQQIYEWRGARDALKILPGTECRLTQSFRFGAQIAHAANGVLMAMGEPNPLRGFDAIQDAVFRTSDAADYEVDAILCRSNAGVIDNIIRQQSAGRRVHVPGGVGELLALTRDAGYLQSGGTAQTLALMAFQDWQEVKEYADGPEGFDLRTFVNLVEAFGTHKLTAALSNILDHPTRDSITVTTGHKSKGLEWDAVKIHSDFTPHGEAADDIPMADRRLFYVAITRAKRKLFVSGSALAAFSS